MNNREGTEFKGKKKKKKDSYALPGIVKVFRIHHLSKEPVDLHAFGCGVATLNEAWPAIDIYQALVVIIINGGTEQPNKELLVTGVVDILEETTHPD